MSDLKASIKQTDDGYELVLHGAAFQGLKKEIVRDDSGSGIKYHFRKEGFDLIAKAFSGIGKKAETKVKKSEPIEVKAEDVHPEEAPIELTEEKKSKKKKKNKK